MKTFAPALLLLALSHSTMAAEPLPTGCFQSNTDGYAMALSRCGVRYCGELRRLDQASDVNIETKDVNNQRRHRRDRSLDQLSVAPMLKRRKNTLHGMLYQADTGESAHTSLRLEGDHLRLLACRGMRCEERLLPRLDKQQCENRSAAL